MKPLERGQVDETLLVLSTGRVVVSERQILHFQSQGELRKWVVARAAIEDIPVEHSTIQVTLKNLIVLLR